MREQRRISRAWKVAVREGMETASSSPRTMRLCTELSNQAFTLRSLEGEPQTSSSAQLNDRRDSAEEDVDHS
jgi:hypothetical protein